MCALPSPPLSPRHLSRCFVTLFWSCHSLSFLLNAEKHGYREGGESFHARAWKGSHAFANWGSNLLNSLVTCSRYASIYHAMCSCFGWNATKLVALAWKSCFQCLVVDRSWTSQSSRRAKQAVCTLIDVVSELDNSSSSSSSSATALLTLQWNDSSTLNFKVCSQRLTCPGMNRFACFCKLGF